MKTWKWLRAYGVALCIFAVVDAVWIMLVAGPQYRQSLSSLMSPSVNPVAAGMFYLMYVAGIVHFAIRPSAPAGAVKPAFFSAMLYGLFTYSTWALTLKALFINVPWSLVFADIAWGIIVSSIVTLATIFLIPDTRHALNSRKKS